ncbi:DNA adenine methylase [Phenylobacterium sp.]|uniref:DNA adenine methylase n=1 Tax=Phenylobacterium sp. TaxID=1871053 RepID=UPI00403605F1
MDAFNTPLRYPGGKGRLSQFVADLIETNGMTGCHYVEPYAGGAGIALTLLYLEYADHIHLNDLNRSVYAFWYSVLNASDELCRMIRDTPVTMDEWRRQKAVQATDASLIDLGFSTFFLNRTNRSGIIKGGVIGGKEQAGNWKLDARYNVADLTRRIEKIAGYSSRISLYNLDAVELIERVIPELPDASLVYLDPPYYVKGKGLYQDHYRHEDHAKIAELVMSKIRQPWIVSYDNVEQIRSLYVGRRQTEFGIPYSAGTTYAGSEVMVFCDDMQIPAVIEPFRGIAA